MALRTPTNAHRRRSCVNVVGLAIFFAVWCCRCGTWIGSDDLYRALTCRSVVGRGIFLAL